MNADIINWNSPMVYHVRAAKEEIDAVPDCAFQRFMDAAHLALLLNGPRAEVGARLDALLRAALENHAQWRREAGF